MDITVRCTISAAADLAIQLASEVVALALFDAGAAAVGEEQTRDDLIVLIAGFSSSEAASAAVLAVEASCAHLVDSVEVRDAPTLEWAIIQRAGLAPTQVGPWRIRAPWDGVVQSTAPKHDVVIDPGVAFGHGGHPSTRLAIDLLDRVAPRFDHVVDLGTGTGVLAIIAARLGLEVLAVENDSAAGAVARKNIERNIATSSGRPSDQVTLVIDDASSIPIPPQSLVVANVTLDIHRELARSCGDSTTLIVSGLLCKQVAAIRGLYPAHTATTIKTHGEWAAVILDGHIGGDSLAATRLRAGSHRGEVEAEREMKWLTT